MPRVELGLLTRGSPPGRCKGEKEDVALPFSPLLLLVGILEQQVTEKWWSEYHTENDHLDI